MAGVRNLGTKSRPTEGQVDLYREIIYTNIGKIIGDGTVDVDDVAQNMERQKVMQVILAYLNDGKVPSELFDLSENEISKLGRTFGDTTTDELTYGVEVFIPSDNVNYY